MDLVFPCFRWHHNGVRREACRGNDGQYRMAKQTIRQSIPLLLELSWVGILVVTHANSMMSYLFKCPSTFKPTTPACCDPAPPPLIFMLVNIHCRKTMPDYMSNVSSRTKSHKRSCRVYWLSHGTYHSDPLTISTVIFTSACNDGLIRSGHDPYLEHHSTFFQQFSFIDEAQLLSMCQCKRQSHIVVVQ